MNIRDKPHYLSTEVSRWLWLLAKAERQSDDDPTRRITPDEIADQILRQAIREQHPQLVKHQKEIDALEKKLIKSLANGKDKQ